MREEYPNPYYWAGFVLSGDGGEVGKMQPTSIEEPTTVGETGAMMMPIPAAASEATPPPGEPTIKEQKSEDAEEAGSWQWSRLVGGLLVAVLLMGGLFVWRWKRHTSGKESEG